MSVPSIFVVGATGTTGGAVARLAIERKWNVHATTRNTSSPEAQALSSLGVKVLQSDWDDKAALKEAMTGCTYLFLNFFPDLQDLSHERKQAQGILQIAKEVGVKRAVYSGGFLMGDISGLSEKHQEAVKNSLVTPILDSKANIEKDVANAGFESWTVLRPGWFMANFMLSKVLMYGDMHQTGVWSTAVLPTTKIPLIDHVDIGKFAIAALNDPARFSGKTIELAGESRTPDEVMRAVSAVAGKKIVAKYQTEEEIDEGLRQNPFLVGQLLSRVMKRGEDQEDINSWGIEMGGFDEFLEREKDLVIKTYESV